MRKTVGLAIDSASWTSAPIEFRHSIPNSFPTSQLTEVEFLGSLLQIGLLTVPWRGAECSLALYWAHVRYCAAIQFDATGLVLTPEWEDLDSHQKTILSDDWGMGFTTHWLASRLSLRSFCDGRYFIERLDGLGIASVNMPPEKRGPCKSPDFVCEDAVGLLHIIECKGNQQGASALRGQLADGVVQKRNILFADEQAQVGQRIVAGLFIAQANADRPSVLAIADPEPNGSLVVKIRQDVDPARIRDVIRRADLARQFRVAGVPWLADEIVSTPVETKVTQRERRREWSEQFAVIRNQVVPVAGVEGGWLHRDAELPFPELFGTGQRPYRAVRVAHAVNSDFLLRFSEIDPSQETLAMQFPNVDDVPLGWVSEEDDNSARLLRGNSFVSEIMLRG